MPFGDAAIGSRGDNAVDHPATVRRGLQQPHHIAESRDSGFALLVRPRK
jgi:hypothetical protein